ncbi:thiopeptide-type bacteriocin biosynthesis protein [Actinomadura napierensis]|uniref:Thiopeptide-type bacteriocin biosynthesis domain-containing protein n=1 Tax=Actinomadura napierensis TaxID=267854 RepID=A0ABN3AGH9_9ACTN
MPPDRLNRPFTEIPEMTGHATGTAAHPPIQQTEGAVLHVLAGTPLGHVAGCFQLQPALLATAVEAYRRAGREALHQQQRGSDWCQFLIEFSDWSSAEETAIEHLVPLLHPIEANASITEWWFIRKHPCWRLRLRKGTSHQPPDLIKALNELAAAGHIRRWCEGVYEPETAAFGGPDGMTTAHELFSADSHAILATLPTNRERLGRREVSILLCSVLFQAAGLEWYEQGDAWHRVAQGRPALTDVSPERLRPMAESFRQLMSADIHPDGSLLGGAGSLAFAAEWAAAFHRAGAALGASARVGALQRGLRQVLAHHVIFHWNRLGLPLRAQSILAAAAQTAILAP